MVAAAKKMARMMMKMSKFARYYYPNLTITLFHTLYIMLQYMYVNRLMVCKEFILFSGLIWGLFLIMRISIITGAKRVRLRPKLNS